MGNPYAEETRQERRREKPRRAYDGAYDRERTPRPKERPGPAPTWKPAGGGGKTGGANTTGDDDGPEEIEYEYNWDTTRGRTKSRVNDEDVDDVIDLTPETTEPRERRHRARRSSFPAPGYSSPGPDSTEYERSRDEYYQNKNPPRRDKRGARHRYSFNDEGAGIAARLFARMRDHHRPVRRGGGGRGLDDYEFRNSHRNEDLGGFETDDFWDDSDLAFDYEMSPRLRAHRGSRFPKGDTFGDGFMPPFPKLDDDFFGRRHRF